MEEGFLRWILESISSSLFKNFIVPTITLVLTVVFKVISKPKRTIERNDWFVCFDLCTLSLFVFVIGMIDLSNQLLNPSISAISDLLDAESLEKFQILELKNLIDQQNQVIFEKFLLSWFVLLIMSLTVFFMSILISSFGWESKTTNSNAKWVEGIAIPNAIGFGLLLIAARWVNP